MSVETADILDRAADIIRRNGWHQGSFCNDGPERTTNDPLEFACCAYGAINVAASSDHPRSTNPKGEAAHNALAQYLGLGDGISNTVADWNDDRHRTAEQVIAALEGAARAEREATS